MLRIAVLVLILANAGYYAWHGGWLRGVGLGPAEQSEPQRLEQQIHPERLRIVGAPPVRSSAETPMPSAPTAAPATSSAEAAASSAASSSSAPGAGEPTACLQAGTFDAKQAEALRQVVAAALPSGTWSLEGTPVAGRWMVYMGRFADDEALEKKRAELRNRKVPFDRPGAALEPGLSLGRYSTEEGAERALATLAGQGVRTARVVQERSDATGYVLRVPEANEALRARLETLRPALGTKALRACG